jgi:hypothetical protein
MRKADQMGSASARTESKDAPPLYNLVLQDLLAFCKDCLQERSGWKDDDDFDLLDDADAHLYESSQFETHIMK